MPFDYPARHEAEKQKENEMNKELGRKPRLQRFKKEYFFYLLVIPGIIHALLFSYLPMVGIYLSFEDYTYQGGLFGSKFVGLKNFEYLFRNMKYALRATQNTLIINLGSICLGLIVNTAVAIVLDQIRNERYRKMTQTVILFPHFLSWVVIGGILEGILGNEYGILNQVILLFGGNPIQWYISPQYWWWIIIIVIIWKEVGYKSIIFYATLTGFDPGLYEAAEIDGASRWKKITKITLPLLKPTIVMLFLLDVGHILGSSLDMIMGLTKLNPLLLKTTDTITTYVYRMGIGQGKFGISSSVSLYQSLVGTVLVLSANFIAKKVDPDYSLF